MSGIAKYFIFMLRENSQIPTFISSLSLTIITVILAFIVFPYYNDKNNFSKDSTGAIIEDPLGRYLIFKNILRPKWILVSIFLCYIPLFLWGKIIPLNLFFLVISIIGIIIQTYVLWDYIDLYLRDFNQYLNKPTKRSELLKKFFSTNKNLSDKFIIFKNIWEQKIDFTNWQKEKEYFEWFIKYLYQLKTIIKDKSVSESELNDTIQYYDHSLTCFNSNFHQRNYNIHHLRIVYLENMIKLFFDFPNIPPKGDIPSWPISMLPLEIINQCLNLIDKNKVYLFYDVCNKMNQQLDKLKEGLDDNKLKVFFNRKLKFFFDRLRVVRILLENYPNEDIIYGHLFQNCQNWLLKKEFFLNPKKRDENPIPSYLLDQFLDVYKTMNKSLYEERKKIESFIEAFIPDINHYILNYFLIFTFSLFHNISDNKTEDRLRNVILIQKSYYQSGSSIDENQQNNTFDFLSNFRPFKGLCTLENLNSYKTSLEKLKPEYKQDPDAAKILKDFITIIENFLKFIKKN